jgi:hypothetical protein
MIYYWVIEDSLLTDIFYNMILIYEHLPKMAGEVYHVKT